MKAKCPFCGTVSDSTNDVMSECSSCNSICTTDLVTDYFKVVERNKVSKR
jgi:hypothetical protein